METLLWPTLAALLFATFLQVPLLHVRDALRDRRFAGAVLLGNFVVLPLLAWALVEVFDFDPVVRLGVLLVLLLILLPLYLWLMADAQSLGSWNWATLAPAVLIVLVPLAAAVLAERWIEAHPKAEGFRDTMAWWPVPLLSLVVFLIACAQVGTVVEAIDQLQNMVPVFVLFLIAAALSAKGIAHQLRLPVEQGR